MSPAELTELTFWVFASGIVTSGALTFAAYHIMLDVFTPQAQHQAHTPNWGPHCAKKPKPGERS